MANLGQQQRFQSTRTRVDPLAARYSDTYQGGDAASAVAAFASRQGEGIKAIANYENGIRCITRLASKYSDIPKALCIGKVFTYTCKSTTFREGYYPCMAKFLAQADCGWRHSSESKRPSPIEGIGGSFLSRRMEVGSTPREPRFAKMARNLTLQAWRSKWTIVPP